MAEKFFGTRHGRANFNKARNAFELIEEWFRGGMPILADDEQGDETHEIKSFDVLLDQVGRGRAFTGSRNIPVLYRDIIDEAMGGLNTVTDVVDMFRANRRSVLQNFTPTSPQQAAPVKPKPQAAPLPQAPKPRPLPKLGEIPGTPTVTALGDTSGMKAPKAPEVTVGGKKVKAAGARGRSSTIFTSRRGVEGPAPIRLAQLGSGSRPLLGS